MAKFKIGDRVRVCWMDDYDHMISKHLNIPLPIGRTGTVQCMRCNSNMAVYGEENGVLVHMDGDREDVLTIWCDKNLELLKDKEE